MKFTVFPKSLKLECASCGRRLQDSDFCRCGSTLNVNPGGLYFEYTCPHCDFFGRLLLELPLRGPVAILRHLADRLETIQMNETAHDERLKAELSRMRTLDDFLRASRKDVREGGFRDEV